MIIFEMQTNIYKNKRNSKIDFSSHFFPLNGQLSARSIFVRNVHNLFVFCPAIGANVLRLGAILSICNYLNHTKASTKLPKICKRASANPFLPPLNSFCTRAVIISTSAITICNSAETISTSAVSFCTSAEPISTSAVSFCTSAGTSSNGAKAVCNGAIFYKSVKKTYKYLFFINQFYTFAYINQ